MKPLITHLAAALLAGSLCANEALDLLEGKITEDEVTLPELDEGGPGNAAAPAPSEPEVDHRDYSKRWRNKLPPLAVVYNNEGNPVVQRVAIDGLAEWGLATGTLQPKGTSTETDINDNQIRRVRLGGMIRAFYNTDLEGRVVGDGDGYQGVDTLKATVQVNEGLQIEAGKFRPPFSQEYKRDPSVRIAPALSPIVAQVAPANTIGGKITGWSGPWEMGLGWFSGDADKDLPGVDGSGFVLASLAYTFDGEANSTGDGGGDAGVPPGHQKWHLDYIYNLDEGTSGSVPKGYEHIVSSGIEVSSGDFDFTGDFILANGPIDTAWGMSLTGRYWLLDDAVRFVGRYSYADTDDPDGLTVGYGVPGAIGDSTQPLLGYGTTMTADEVHSFYGGLDWHLYDDYLMLMTGLEYQLLKSATGGDIDSWLWHTGGRVAF